MWWHDIADLDRRLDAVAPARGDAVVEDGAILDETGGAIALGPGTRICAGAHIKGPVRLGRDCLVGSAAFLRGPVWGGDGVRIGYATEIKQALIGDEVAIGPMCFVADSRVDTEAYLGAMVRTSNQRLDRGPVSVLHEGEAVDTGLAKLGAWIGTGAMLGIQCVILPGRVVAPRSLFEPQLTIRRNHPAGHYRATQTIVSV